MLQIGQTVISVSRGHIYVYLILTRLKYNKKTILQALAFFLACTTTATEQARTVSGITADPASMHGAMELVAS